MTDHFDSGVLRVVAVCACGSERIHFTTCEQITGRPGHTQAHRSDCLDCGMHHDFKNDCPDCRAIAEEHR